MIIFVINLKYCMCNTSCVCYKKIFKNCTILKIKIKFLLTLDIVCRTVETYQLILFIINIQKNSNFIAA